MTIIRLAFYWLLLIACWSCQDLEVSDFPAGSITDPVQLMSPDQTDIRFSNDLPLTEEVNPYTYRNFYNGAGVGLGDFNNDGLLDIFFSGNRVNNQLYYNQGNWVFKVAELPNLSSERSWSTGVTVVDINADGWDDIYLSKSGPPSEAGLDDFSGVRHNELFINQQDGTFAEQAAAYGLDFTALGIHAVFFDYDQDGDLDAYLLSNSNRSVAGYDLVQDARNTPDPQGGNRLLRCDWPSSPNGQIKYVDVSEEAGIYHSAIGFGLGVTAGDVDLDGRTDLFVANDYFERDYLYYNRGQGLFEEALVEQLPEISLGSMGADLADLDNDGLPELFVTEMLPRTDERYKTKAIFQPWNRYQLYRDKGYHQQFSRNVLQWNRGDGRFSEISRLSGVEATDWSWGALLFDIDADGWKDIFVANGIGKDLIDQDYIHFDGNPEVIRKSLIEDAKSILTLFEKVPSERLVNGVFRNQGDLRFEDVASKWGMDQPTFSNGAAYGDLDNDGDLDLVVSNLDQPAFVYRNNTVNNSLLVHLTDATQQNNKAIGAKLIIYLDEQLQYQEIQPVRGFQSTGTAAAHFGLGTAKAVDSLRIVWPDGRQSLVQNLSAGRWQIDRSSIEKVTAEILDANRSLLLEVIHPATWIPPLRTRSTPKRTYLQAVAIEGAEGHRESQFIDFDRDPLLPYSLSNEGPALAVGDVNGDGLTDFYQGGAKGQAGQLYIAGRSNTFERREVPAFAAHADREDTDAVFFDADGDGDQDLYVASGSYEFGRNDTKLLDRLYLNESGRWTASDQLLPHSSQLVSSSCVRPYDVDGDGDLDLFVGGRLRPGMYGVPTDSYLLLNEGNGKFTSQTLPELGMVTDAVWLEADRGAAATLLVVGEYMAPTLLEIESGGKIRSRKSLIDRKGLWLSADARIAEDGSQRIVLGNHGLNSRLRASEVAPLQLFVNDFDGNGKVEQILCQKLANGESLPLIRKDELVGQLPALKKTLLRYEDYAGRTMQQIFSPEILSRSVVQEVDELASVEVIFTKEAVVEIKYLPLEAQLQPVYAICYADVDANGVVDLLLGGNQLTVKPELGIYAAGFGQLLKGLGSGEYEGVAPWVSGMDVSGEIRQIVALGKDRWIIARSNGYPILLSTNLK